MKGRVIGRDFVTYPFGYDNIPFPEAGSPEQFLVKALVDDCVETENLRRCEPFSSFNEESDDFFFDKTFAFPEDTAE